MVGAVLLKKKHPAPTNWVREEARERTGRFFCCSVSFFMGNFGVDCWNFEVILMIFPQRHNLRDIQEGNTGKIINNPSDRGDVVAG